MLKVPVADAEPVSLMLLTPTTAQFWGVPGRYWKEPEWQKLSYRYLERITAKVPGAVIKQFSSGLDIKYKDKPLPIELLQPHMQEITDAMRQAIHDMEAYYKARESLSAA